VVELNVKHLIKFQID